jgi:hypothetical protein
MKNLAFDPLEKITDEVNRFSWVHDASVKGILDVIASILAEDYIQIAEQNPEVFKEES